jgi:hydroxypyruvate isomerase
MEFGLCIEMAFAELPFEERVKMAANLGLKNVEMWFVDMSFREGPDELAKIADNNNVTITNTVIGSPDGSIGGGLTNPVCRRQWFERAKMTIDFTKEAGIPATIVCTGNIVQDLNEEQMMQSVMEGLMPTVEMAEKAGVTLLLEPLNDRYDHPGYFLTSSDVGAEICRKIASPSMKLLFDCYHMQIMEGDLVRHIEQNIDVIGHFHSAGVPGRHELYNGETDYPFVLRQIESFGYKGVFGLEYQPSIDDEESVRKTLDYLKARVPD